MAKSMTGFGIGEYKNDSYNVSVECKAINHKYLDINPRLPRKISFLEDKLRSLVKDYLGRGRIDLFIKFDTVKSSGVKLQYDDALASQYHDILLRIKSDFNIDDKLNVTDIAKFPEIITASESEEDEDLLWGMLSEATEISLKKLCEMRVAEGKKLEEDILNRTDILEKTILDIEKYSDNVVIEYKEKLNNKISEILENPSLIDESRLAQEVAIYADKSSITEEIVRFKSHIVQLRNTVKKDDTVGRKMDFLIQEMNREVNTIGSKSSNIDITNLVIDIKAELEKIREQIQNIE